MNGRRSTLECYVQILSALQTQKLKLSHIMYKTGTNNTDTKKRLDRLRSHGLITQYQIGRRVIFGITMKGLQLLNSFDAIQQTLGLEAA